MNQPDRRDVMTVLGAALGVGLPSTVWAQAGAAPEVSALERIRKLGKISIAVYQDMPPFHVAGNGIDVDVAKGIAQGLGVSLSLSPFTAGENMEDDLRAMVWRGHYLGFGPADVLLHVPVDTPLMQASPRVSIFAPYYRERLAIARNLAKVPSMASMADFKGHRIAVPGQSLAGWLLIGSDGGAYRDQLDTKHVDATHAARQLISGQVVAAAGHASELESVLAGDARFAVEPLPLPRMRDGWPIGCAVRRESGDLAQAVRQVVEKMNDSGAMRKIFTDHKVAWAKP